MGKNARVWTEEQDRLLLRMNADEALPAEMAAAIGDGCKEYHIYTRLYRLRQGAPIRSGRRVESKTEEWSRSQVAVMDGEFALAMKKAISAGAENPVVGVVTTPSTKRARYLPTSTFLPSQSVAADVAAMGAAGGAFF